METILNEGVKYWHDQAEIYRYILNHPLMECKDCLKVKLNSWISEWENSMLIAIRCHSCVKQQINREG